MASKSNTVTRVKGQRASLVCILLFTIFIHQTGHTMGFFSGKVNVFSTVDGVVMNKGEPIAGALVKRSYSLDGNEITDSVTTDAQGKFSFDSINIKSLRALYPHNPYVFQRISIETNGQSYIAWSYQKRNYDENGERLGKPLKMHCDITNEKAVHPANEAFDYSGICTLI